MSHRADQKHAAREARLRAEAQAERTEQRQRLMRRAGYGAVGVIAAVLIVLAITLNSGNSAVPANHDAMPGHSGTTTAAASPGTKAPNFSLTDVISGKPVTAASLPGRKTMLFFSEGVNCQACMVQAADLGNAGILKKQGIDLVSVTTDQPGELAVAAKQYGIKTPLLADPTTEMSSAYGMLGHGGMEHPSQDGHAFMLVDANGKILWHKAYQEMYVKPQQLLRDMAAEAIA